MAEETSTASILDQARQEREKLEQILPQVREQVKQMQEIEARRVLGGKTDAGQQPQKAPEVSPQDYAQKALRGQI